MKKRKLTLLGAIMKNKADIVIVGTGVAGLYCALNLPHDKDI